MEQTNSANEKVITRHKTNTAIVIRRCLPQPRNLTENTSSSSEDNPNKGVSMLSENIKAARKSCGLSQEELALELNVVRQTISKWERGLSVPDSNMLIELSKTLETPVSDLLEVTDSTSEKNEPKALAERLESIELQLTRQRRSRRRFLQCILLALCIAIVFSFVCLIMLDSPYLEWDLDDPELAVAGTLYHGFEWIFIRLAPIFFLVTAGGLLRLKKCRLPRSRQ